MIWMASMDCKYASPGSIAPFRMLSISCYSAQLNLEVPQHDQQAREECSVPLLVLFRLCICAYVKLMPSSSGFKHLLSGFKAHTCNTWPPTGSPVGSAISYGTCNISLAVRQKEPVTALREPRFPSLLPGS